ncbi:MAG: 1,4-alpha-glucan branching protein GlgB [Clostridia bacterium]|nr:1,4-alpha-glucan branching protein GlgB [Clostridia bacterium]
MGRFSDFDSYLFHEGTNYEAYKKLGAHIVEENGVIGTNFAVWAPSAKYVALITAPTGWETEIPMERSNGGVWEKFLACVGSGDAYRYVIVGADGVKRYKSDPYSFRMELRPDNASIVFDLNSYEWGDSEYQSRRDNKFVVQRPMSTYEVHLGSWKRNWSANGFLNYRELADQLAEYVTYMGYTHVELMGICEYPFDGSWGYQVTGYFAPTSRYGDPNDFRYLVDKLHQSGVGVILDWVPAHFPKDSFCLEKFDGTPLYEPADPLRAEYPEWGTYAFDHGKPEVRSFLISSAFYWINEFHVDALRVDAVAAMIYASFSRAEWRPNMFGGNINLESRDFLCQLNHEVIEKTTGYLIAEDSSMEWGITSPTYDGGYGFMFKWSMGWMNDVLRYIGKDPIYRQHHHYEMTHCADYAFLENYILSISHDEVVHLKHSLAEKAPGSIMDRLGGLKTFYTYMYTFPGKKLLFMGQEFAMDREWSENREIDWYLCDEFGHRDVMESVRRLNYVYKTHPTLYSDSRNPTIFQWVNAKDYTRNIFAYIRRNPWTYDDAVLVVCNFSPMQYDGYTCGCPMGGKYKRIFSTYDTLPNGGGPRVPEEGPEICSYEGECDGYSHHIAYNLRPFESMILEFPKSKESFQLKQIQAEPAQEVQAKSVQEKPTTKKPATRKKRAALKKKN